MRVKVRIIYYHMIKKRMSAPYREVASRLKKLLATGRVIEGSLCRADRGDAVRYQLSDRATGSQRSLYVPQDFADDVARWSANWATVKALLRELGEIARAELVEAITARTGRRTVRPRRRGKSGKGAGRGAGPRKRPTAKRRSRS